MLAQALWRNIWGAGWGTVAGVKRKLAGIDKLAEERRKTPEGQPELARDAATINPQIASGRNASPYALRLPPPSPLTEQTPSPPPSLHQAITRQQCQQLSTFCQH